MKRRTFIRSGVAGTAGLLTVQAGAMSGINMPEENIICRTLGKTGIKVPVVSFGVMRSDNSSLVKAAYDAGIKLFDTANGYQNGRNEEMLGNFFADIPRESFFLATKVKPAGVDRQTGKPSRETTANDFNAKFNESLQRLKMDYVDILYMHAIDAAEMVRHKETVNAMLDLKKKGKVRFIGISTHKNEPLVIKTMVEDGIWDVVLTSYNFKQDHVSEMNDALQMANEAGMGVVAMKTMAGGFFDRERTKPVNAPAALKWALNNTHVHTSIPGITTFDQLEQDLRVMKNLEMNDEEKSALTALSDCQGLYCNACGRCTEGCVHNLPVPEAMRAYMYAFGYGSYHQAYQLLLESGIRHDACADCSECTSVCTKGFDIRSRITDIARLSLVPEDFIV